MHVLVDLNVQKWGGGGCFFLGSNVAAVRCFNTAFCPDHVSALHFFVTKSLLEEDGRDF